MIDPDLYFQAKPKLETKLKELFYGKDKKVERGNRGSDKDGEYDELSGAGFAGNER